VVYFLVENMKTWDNA